jgi:hypothetical protein
MKSAFKAALCALLLPALLSARPDAHFPGKEPYTKTIQKEFAIPENGTTYLSNKYGKVEVKTWDKDRVKITVQIVVKAYSSTAADDVFERIQIQFSNGENYVKASTVIESANRSWWSWFETNRSDYSIHYEVFLPETNQLDVTHRYGDLYAASMSGKVRLDIKYVNFKAEGLGDHSSLTMGYGNGSIGQAKNLSATVSYSKLAIEEAHNVDFTTRYAEIRLEKAKDVRADSRYDTYVLGQVQDLSNTGSYDDFRIGSAASLSATTSYSHFKVEKVAQALNLTVKYTDTDIKLGSAFRSATCNGSYSDFKIGVPASASYQIEGYANYAGLQYPDNIDIEYEVQKHTEHTLRGKVGQGGPRIALNARYGGIKVYSY